MQASGWPPLHAAESAGIAYAAMLLIAAERTYLAVLGVDFLWVAAVDLWGELLNSLPN